MVRTLGPCLLLPLAFACVDDADDLGPGLGGPGDTGVIDTGEPDTGVEDTGPNAVCCPVDTPTCSCFRIGGTMQGGICPSVCDADPNQIRYETDSNGCEVVVTGGSCFQNQPDSGPTDIQGTFDFGVMDGGSTPACDPAPRGFAGTWRYTLAAATVGDHYLRGMCVGTGFDQHLSPLEIRSDGSFEGIVFSDFIERWYGCVVRDGDGYRLDVTHCDRDCRELVAMPGWLGRVELAPGPAGQPGLRITRSGRAYLPDDPSTCTATCGPAFPTRGQPCSRVEGVQLEIEYAP